jgi:hypothetical protein
MTREEINQKLIDLGWKRYRDELKDSIFLVRVDTGLVSFVSRNNAYGIDLNPSISTDLFDKFEHIIGARDIDYYTGKVTRHKYVTGSIICQTRYGINKQDYTTDDVVMLSEKILDWAASVDIEAALAELRALAISSLGAMPVRHMTALAVAGDVETLGHYRDRFAAGDRMDCVPYITIDYITRALELAEKRKADPNWIPDKPKIRV